MTFFVAAKKILGLLLFLLLFFLSVAVPARAEVLLTAIEKDEDPNRTRLILTLSEEARFSVDHNAQRVELILEETNPGTSLRQLPEDGTIVRMTLIRKPPEFVVSLLLRRAPVQVIAETRSNPHRIVLDLLWRGDDSARPAIAFRVGDLPPRIPGAAGTSLQRQSPWDGHWLEFFQDYRSSWQFELPLELTPPPALQLVADRENPLWPLQQLANDKLYLSLLEGAGALSGLDTEQRYQRDLLMADAFLRTQSYAAGLARLEPWLEHEGEYQNLVHYLRVWGEVARNNPLEGLVHLRARLADLPSTDILAPAVTLLHTEAALAAKQYQLALEQLEDPAISWPASLEFARTVRRADAVFGLDQRDPALALYREVADASALCEFYHSSCNRAAYAAFVAEDYSFARQLYLQLAAVIPEGPGADLVHFAAGAAAYEAGDFDWGWIGLEQVTQDYPDTEGGDRARMRLLDIRIVNGDEQALVEAAPGYGRLGRESTYRQIREESLFKEALALFLAEEHQQSVRRLMQYQRDFRSSPLRREATLLLVRQLPLVVDKLLAEGQDLDAVVLVEQNRDLLLAGGYDRDFLNNLVIAFERLGLYDRATRVLLYLFDRSSNPAVRSQLYLPLAKSYKMRNLYNQAADYAREYLDRYPDGADGGALYVMLLDLLERDGREDEARELLQRPGRPQTPDVARRVAQAYWRQNNFQAVVDNLEMVAAEQPLAVKDLALLAEAHYRLGNLDPAQGHYQQLLEAENFSSQARYRYAQTLLQQGRRGAAVEQLQQLVDGDSDSAWGQLARDLLIQQARGN